MAEPEIVSALLRIDRDVGALSQKVDDTRERIDVLGNRITSLESAANTLRWIIPLLVAILMTLLANAAAGR